LGGDVLAAYPMGGVIGRLLKTLVDAEAVPSLTVAISGETREDFTVVEADTRQEYRFVLPGPQLSEDEWRKCMTSFTSWESAPRFIVASGSLPPGAPADFYARIAQAARAGGAKFVVDTSGPGLNAALDEGVYLIKPSLGEMQELVGAPLADRRARIEACHRLVDAQRAEIVALTLGDEGALLVTRERAWSAQAPSVEIVSAVGAGDSFLGAMVWALAAGRALDDAFRYGVAAGSAALLTPGTELCRPADVERLLAEVRLQAI
jgi:6-phosphofructokinase 2